MKKFKKLIPAFCAMLVSAAMLGTSTYAWFSVNKKVEANGMSVTALAETQYFVISNTAGTFETNDEHKGQKLTLTENTTKVNPISFTAPGITTTTSGLTNVPANHWYTAQVDTYDGLTESGSVKYTSLETVGAAASGEKNANNVYSKTEYFVSYTFYVGLAETSSDFSGYLKFVAGAATNGVKIAGIKVSGTTTASASSDEYVAITDYTVADDTANAQLGYTAEQYKLVAKKDGTPATYATVVVYAFIDGTEANIKDSNINTDKIKGAVSLVVTGETTKPNKGNA